MTLAAEQAVAEKALIWLYQQELCYRIEGASWTHDGTYANCWRMDHLLEGSPSRVRQLLRSSHAISEYTERASATLCNANPSSWYYDTASGQLYLHTSGSDSPATASKYYISSHFWRSWVTHQFPMPDTIYGEDGRFIEPRLIVAIPEYNQEVNDFTRVGVVQTWSSIQLNNADGEMDASFKAVDESFRAHAYIWNMCPCYLKVGSKGDAIGDFSIIARGRTGSVGWTDQAIEIRTEDQLRNEE